MKSEHIMDLLKHKYEDHIIVPECTVQHVGDNRTYRLDMWVMIKSYTNPLTIGLEVKVDRKDFENDKKWHVYRDFCNEFYFICPWGLILPEDIPKGVGLYWISKTGNRIYIKQKAVYQDTDPRTMDRTIKGILINRCLISKRHRSSKNDDKRAYFEEWMEKREINHTFGRKVSKAIRKEVRNGILKQERANRELQYKLQGLIRMEELVKELYPDQDLSDGLEVCGIVNTLRREISKSPNSKKVEELAREIINLSR